MAKDMSNYSVEIARSTTELSARDRIKIKDLSNAVDLDQATQSGDGMVNIVINYAYHVILKIHNEKSESKDYTKVVVVDKDGTKFTTGSNSFITALDDIVDEMIDCGETDFEIDVYRKDSKNYPGRQFITCSLK